MPSWAAESRLTRVAIALVTLAGVVLGPVTDAIAHPEDVYEFEGSGWGHGIGMSQYGARAMAAEGHDHAGILAHYYTGTSLSTIGERGLPLDHPLVSDPDPVWVGAEQNVESATVEFVGGPGSLCHDDGDACVPVDTTVSSVWEFRATETGCSWLPVFEEPPPSEEPPPEDGAPEPGSHGMCRSELTWGDEGNAQFVSINGSPCSAPVGPQCFQRGSMHFRPAPEGFHVVVELGIEDYLYGLGEMPSSWPAEALAAQAVAGRSYLFNRVLGKADPGLATATDPGFSVARQEACWCHLYSSTQDQKYIGYAKEAEASETIIWGELWMAAVDATADTVITHPAADTTHGVITAFYHSSSGGTTENNEDVWAGTPLPYLRSVDDHWSQLPAANNPFSSWTMTATAGEIAAGLGLAEVDDITLLNLPPAAQLSVLTDTEVVEISGAALRAAAGLRSGHVKAVSLDRFYPFLDMEGLAHTDAIMQIWEAGITNGCEPGFYCPNDTVTRGQMATFLSRALDLPDPLVDHFDDDNGHAHEDGINRLAEAGITNGCGEGSFCPNEAVERQQMATFLGRSLELDPIPEGPFADLSGGFHDGFINAIAAAGITSGCGPGSYCPTAEVTRAQMASFLARAFLSSP